MYTIDERLKGLPAVKEQVVQLYQSLNQPHLAVPGRSAGPSTAYVLGLRGPSGFAVFVYLYLSEAGQCAVYVPTNGTVAADKYQAEEGKEVKQSEKRGAGECGRGAKTRERPDAGASRSSVRSTRIRVKATRRPVPARA